MPKMTPIEFYTHCLKKTHELAEKYGIVKGGVKFIPELMPYCDRLIDSDLNCEELLDQCPDNAQLLRIVCYRCMMYGIILADTWHTAFNKIEEVFMEVEFDGPNGLIQPLVEEELGYTPTCFSQWMDAVYKTCMIEFASVKTTTAGEEYSFKMMAACYQMGISMMLSHYGL